MNNQKPKSRDYRKLAHDGLMGLLIGDALGVPYEFHPSANIPPVKQVEFDPPQGFDRTYPSIQPGTWSDDGAQALCLLDSLVSCGRLDMQDFGNRLVRWYEDGLWAVDNHVFDCGIQTMQSIKAFANGTPPDQSGNCIPDGKGNGALMRVLPLALWHSGDDYELVRDAHAQAMITHGHVCNQVCCALYCLWARRLLVGENAKTGYAEAVGFLKSHYENQPDCQYELECCIADGVPKGTGYVVDSIRSAKHLLFTYNDYERVVKEAIRLGNDTDTTAAIAGGLAGIAFGNIPQRWLSALRNKEKVYGLLDKWKG